MCIGACPNQPIKKKKLRTNMYFCSVEYTMHLVLINLNELDKPSLCLNQPLILVLIVADSLKCHRIHI